MSGEPMAATRPKIAKMIEGLDREQLAGLVARMTPEESRAILDDWSLWALPHQRLPEGDWRRWVLRAGRGSGKTHAASRTVNEVARDRSKIKTGEIGIVARTWSDARFTCVEGVSGVLATAPTDFRPAWHPGIGLLVWPNAVRGRIFSADKPASMRGPNWAFLWADEVCQWPDVERTWWEVIELALRVGWSRCILSTTPRPHPFLRELEKRGDTVVTHATTYQNPWLDEGTKRAFVEVYEGTRRGLQELMGQILEDVHEALWRRETIERFRVTDVPELRQVVVAVDPAVTSGPESDETGIVVYGADAGRHGYLLADESGRYTPTEWAERVVRLYHLFRADRIIAEVNNGGDLVERNVRAVDDRVAFRAVRATRGKLLRAEPVSALYERGMVHHVGVYADLEEQQVTWVPGHYPSPDRLDALVYAATDVQLSGEKVTLPASAYL